MKGKRTVGVIEARMRGRTAVKVEKTVIQVKLLQCEYKDSQQLGVT